MKERGNSYLRFLDRYLGIPFVIFLSLFKRKDKIPLHPNTLALLKTAGIGDLVLLSAVIRDLRHSFPSLRITLFTGLSNSEMGRLIEGINVIALPITSPWKSLKILRKEKYDVWIDCDPWPRINALFSFFSCSRCKIGFKTEGQYRERAFDYAVAHSPYCHEIENYRRLFSILGVKGSSSPCFSFPFPKKTRQIALHLFAGGSRAHLKQWEDKKWEELITFFIQEGYHIAFTGGKAEFTDLERMKQKFREGSIENYAGRLTLQETAQLLVASECVISIDTGIMHFAAALGCPLVALHGPTSSKRWGAIGKNVVAVSPLFPYDPCIHLGFEAHCQKNLCMQSITVEQVKQAFYQVQKGVQ